MARKQRTSKETKELFRDPSGQVNLFEKSYQEELEAKAKKSVECLGMTFENDEARRSYFLEKLREKLKDPEFRKIEGFPIGSDEDILTLSDPPYYTACPNPFIEDFIRCYGKPYDPKTDNYRREPFAADVSEGKNDPIYNAHSYHTKVPHKAIMRYILHYTEPGDIVFDGFCGTGMTGVAAQLCGDKAVVESLGYKVQRDGTILGVNSKPFSKIGTRRAIQIDLSPAATFIAYNYNTPVSAAAFEREAKRILKEVEDECGWMYETIHKDSKTKGRINFTVWSEIHTCPECAGEIIFAQEALDPNTSQVREEFPCPHCHATVTKNNSPVLYESKFDPTVGETVKAPKRIPVLINYSVGGSKYKKKPDKRDLDILRRVNGLALPPEVPTTLLPDMQMTRVGRMQTASIRRVHHFFLPRTAQILGAFWARADAVSGTRLRGLTKFWIESQFVNMSVRNRYRPEVSFPYNPLTGVYYIPAMVSEPSVFIAYENKLRRIVAAFAGLQPMRGQGWIETVSASNLRINSSSVDYIFTDPPFGENIYYSDLNFFVESWFRVFTNVEPEAIVDRVKKKDLIEYQRLMERCFVEYHRVVKPGRWITVEFHNSKNSVWNAIQESLPVSYTHLTLPTKRIV